MQTAAAAPAEQSISEKPIRVMIVDDSAVVRGLVARWMGEEPGLEAVARHPNGKLAVEDVARSVPDVILLDIEMPVMNGLEALPLLLRARPGVRVLMVSTHTKRNAEISLKALTLGALDYVSKPDTNREITTLPDFRQEIVHKVKALAAVHTRADAPHAPRRVGPVTKRGYSLVPPRVMVIGSSTGGPVALSSMLQALSPSLGSIPVLVAQHMPAMFTTVLAERLAGVTGLEVREAVDGEPLRPGRVYLAPGDFHMTVCQGLPPTLAVRDGPPVHFCRPAVDPLFTAAAAVFGPATLAVVLTGMGQDGAEGALAVANAGGTVIAQDEASSVVWGMPGAAAATGACAALLPPPEIAQVAAKLIAGVRG